MDLGYGGFGGQLVTVARRFELIRSVKQSIDLLVREHLRPLLKARGFKGGPRHFVRENQHSVDCVGIRTPPGSYQGVGCFYLSVGVYHPDWYRLIGADVPDRPEPEDCDWLYGCPAAYYRISPDNDVCRVWELVPDLDLDEMGRAMVEQLSVSLDTWFPSLLEPVQAFRAGWFDDLGPLSYGWMSRLYGPNRPHEIVKGEFERFLASDGMHSADQRARWLRILAGLDALGVDFGLEAETWYLLENPHAYQPIESGLHAFDRLGDGVGDEKLRAQFAFEVEKLETKLEGDKDRTSLVSLIRRTIKRIDRNDPGCRDCLLRIRRVLARLLATE
jgi:hypothetical protein